MEQNGGKSTYESLSLRKRKNLLQKLDESSQLNTLYSTWRKERFSTNVIGDSNFKMVMKFPYLSKPRSVFRPYVIFKLSISTLVRLPTFCMHDFDFPSGALKDETPNLTSHENLVFQFTWVFQFSAILSFTGGFWVPSFGLNGQIFSLNSNSKQTFEIVLNFCFSAFTADLL